MSDLELMRYAYLNNQKNDYAHASLVEKLDRGLRNLYGGEAAITHTTYVRKAKEPSYLPSIEFPKSEKAGPLFSKNEKNKFMHTNFNLFGRQHGVSVHTGFDFRKVDDHMSMVFAACCYDESESAIDELGAAGTDSIEKDILGYMEEDITESGSNIMSALGIEHRDAYDTSSPEQKGQHPIEHAGRPEKLSVGSITRRFEEEESSTKGLIDFKIFTPEELKSKNKSDPLIAVEDIPITSSTEDGTSRIFYLPLSELEAKNAIMVCSFNEIILVDKNGEDILERAVTCGTMAVIKAASKSLLKDVKKMIDMIDNAFVVQPFHFAQNFFLPLLGLWGKDDYYKQVKETYPEVSCITPKLLAEVIEQQPRDFAYALTQSAPVHSVYEILKSDQGLQKLCERSVFRSVVDVSPFFTIKLLVKFFMTNMQGGYSIPYLKFKDPFNPEGKGTIQYQTWKGRFEQSSRHRNKFLTKVLVSFANRKRFSPECDNLKIYAFFKPEKGAQLQNDYAEHLPIPTRKDGVAFMMFDESHLMHKSIQCDDAFYDIFVSGFEKKDFTPEQKKAFEDRYKKDVKDHIKDMTFNIRVATHEEMMIHNPDVIKNRTYIAWKPEEKIVTVETFDTEGRAKNFLDTLKDTVGEIREALLKLIKDKNLLEEIKKRLQDSENVEQDIGKLISKTIQAMSVYLADRAYYTDLVLQHLKNGYNDRDLPHYVPLHAKEAIFSQREYDIVCKTILPHLPHATDENNINLATDAEDIDLFQVMFEPDGQRAHLLLKGAFEVDSLKPMLSEFSTLKISFMKGLYYMRLKQYVTYEEASSKYTFSEEDENEVFLDAQEELDTEETQVAEEKKGWLPSKTTIAVSTAGIALMAAAAYYALTSTDDTQQGDVAQNTNSTTNATATPESTASTLFQSFSQYDFIDGVSSYLAKITAETGKNATSDPSIMENGQEWLSNLTSQASNWTAQASEAASNAFSYLDPQYVTEHWRTFTSLFAGNATAPESASAAGPGVILGVTGKPRKQRSKETFRCINLFSRRDAEMFIESATYMKIYVDPRTILTLPVKST